MGGLLSTPEERLMAVLEDRRWYSYSAEALGSQLGVSRRQLGALAARVQEVTGRQINVFRYRGVEYMGLEERRLDYERDKAAGANWVEAAIARGEYDHDRNQKKNRVIAC